MKPADRLIKKNLSGNLIIELLKLYLKICTALINCTENKVLFCFDDKKK